MPKLFTYYDSFHTWLLFKQNMLVGFYAFNYVMLDIFVNGVNEYTQTPSKPFIWIEFYNVLCWIQYKNRKSKYIWNIFSN
jgi:hypothetical protein